MRVLALFGTTLHGPAYRACCNTPLGGPVTNLSNSITVRTLHFQQQRRNLLHRIQGIDGYRYLKYAFLRMVHES